MSGVKYSAAFEAITAVHANQAGRASDESTVELLADIAYGMQSHDDVIRLLHMLSRISVVLLARLAVATEVESAAILQGLALEWAAVDDSDDEA